MSAEASEMVSIPRAEPDALKSELKRPRRAPGERCRSANMGSDMAGWHLKSVLLAYVPQCCTARFRPAQDQDQAS